jgi:TATA-box binding protein (TBP) (component of TFIID and TFIIIB)
MKTKIVNIVVSGALNRNIDVHKLRELKEISYSFDEYIGRIPYFNIEMEGRVSILPKGRIISTMAKSVEKAIQELDKAMATLIKNHVVKDDELNPAIQDIVVSFDFAENVSLESLTEKKNALRNPEQFIVLKYDDPIKASIAVFASGFVMITGLKSITQIEPILRKFEEPLKEPNCSPPL